MSDTHLIPLPRLQAAMQQLMRGFGSSEAEVMAVSNNLIEANLTGHDLDILAQAAQEGRPLPVATAIGILW